MKLYFHPVSTTSRPILLLAADEKIALDHEIVDLFSGAHLAPAYTSLNPSQQVPMLDDDGFRLTESSAILKYLAEKSGSATYPRDLKARARVNERMDWLNTGLYRDLGYGFIYAQCLPNYKAADAGVQSANLGAARARASRWLTILDNDILGKHAWMCGDALTIADYLGVCMLTLGEVTKLDYSPWRNVSRWIAAMKARPNWGPVNEAFYAHFVGGFAAQDFVTL